MDAVPESVNEFQALLQRVRDGSQDAVQELVDEYGPHVLRVVRRKLNKKLRSKFDSIDFVQDVWKSFFTDPQHLDFQRPEELLAFLVNMARNKVIEEFRQRLQTKKRGGDREHSLHGSAAGQAGLVPAEQPTPSQCAVANEKWEQMLEGQPDHYQRILLLLRQGKEHEEIARMLGVNEKTVRRLIQKLAPRFAP